MITLPAYLCPPTWLISPMLAWSGLSTVLLLSPAETKPRARRTRRNWSSRTGAMIPHRTSRPRWPQIRMVGEWWMSTASGNLDARPGTRVNSERFDSGRGSDEYILLSLSGRRKARRNVERSVSEPWAGDVSTGIEGKYLKLGNRNADVRDGDKALELGGKDDALRRILLNGCKRVSVSLLQRFDQPTSEYWPPRPSKRFKPRTSFPQLAFLPSFSMRLVQSRCPVQITICCAYAAIVPFNDWS